MLFCAGGMPRFVLLSSLLLLLTGPNSQAQDAPPPGEWSELDRVRAANEANVEATRGRVRAGLERSIDLERKKDRRAAIALLGGLLGAVVEDGALPPADRRALAGALNARLAELRTEPGHDLKRPEVYKASYAKVMQSLDRYLADARRAGADRTLVPAHFLFADGFAAAGALERFRGTGVRVLIDGRPARYEARNVPVILTANGLYVFDPKAGAHRFLTHQQYDEFAQFFARQDAPQLARFASPMDGDAPPPARAKAAPALQKDIVMIATVALSTLVMRSFTEGEREGGGYGRALGDDARCHHCGGRGSFDRRTGAAAGYVRTTCPSCQGAGRSR